MMGSIYTLLFATVPFLLLTSSVPAFAADIKAAFEAVESGDARELRRLVTTGVNVNGRNDGATLLMEAAFAGSNEMIEFLVARGADVNARYKSGQTALHFGAIRGKSDVVRTLLDHGAEVNATDESNRTALGYVILTGAANGWSQLGFLRRLAARYLFRASPTERQEVARLLLDRGAIIDSNPKDASMVYAAANFGDKELVNILIAHGAKLEDARTGETPLHAAIAEKHSDVTELLINKGANVNARNINDRTPLHFVASLLDDPELAELLIRRGADVNAREKKFGATPLTFAVGKGNLRVATILRRHGGI